MTTWINQYLLHLVLNSNYFQVVHIEDSTLVARRHYYSTARSSRRFLPDFDLKQASRC